DDPDPGVHSATSWLLRHKDEGPTARALDWGQADRLAKIDEELRDSRGGARGQAVGWYVNRQGQTVGMVKGPVEFRRAWPPWEPGRHADSERRHVQEIEKDFAIASAPVTEAQYRRFLRDNPDLQPNHPGPLTSEGLPIRGVTWFAAVRYCNWLSNKEGIPE